MSSARGFTLIELLVVIAIMAIVGTFAIANFRTFGEDQDLKSAALDLQSLIRTAQTDATTGVRCDDDPTHTLNSWRVNVYKQLNKYRAQLACVYNVGASRGYVEKKVDTLKDNLKIENITGDSVSCVQTLPGDIEANYYATVVFTPISGQVGFVAGNGFAADGSWQGIPCFGSTNTFRVNVQNTKTMSTKSLTVDRGGRVYEQ